MKRILACAGVNGDETALLKLISVAKEKKPDGILFAGGILADGTRELHRVDFMTRFFRLLAETGLTVAAIPGPNDTPLWQFLRVALNTEIIYPNIFVAHATPIVKGEAAVSGIGGLLTDLDDSSNSVIRYSHPTAEYFLRSLWRAVQPIKVLLLSEPPPGKLAGNQGNKIVREFIKTYHPTICVVAGSKKNRGVETDDPHTVVVNPGAVAEGSAAWIERVAGKTEMLDL